MKKQYEQFKSFYKKLFPEIETTFYDNVSIDGNPLFFNNSIFKDEDFNSVDFDFLKKLNNELDLMESKYTFTNSYVDSVIDKLSLRVNELDEEFDNLVSLSSFKANSFLKMFDNIPEGQKVCELEPIFSKNCLFNDDKIHKTLVDKVEIKNYCKIDSNNSLRFVFEKSSKINQILINSSKGCIINIFGRLNNGDLINIVNGLNTSEQSNFIVESEKEFTELLIISNENIKNYISKLTVFKIENVTMAISDITALTIYNSVKFDEVIKISFFNSNATKIFSVDENIVSNLIKELELENFSVLKDKYSNSIKEIYKGEFYSSTDCRYIIEVMGPDVNTSSKMMAFGIEEE